MKLYNTLTRQIEAVIPRETGKIGMYACGPTVYDYAHIGHMRKYTMDDVLVRTLQHAGLAVTHVMNITDVGHLVSDGDEGEDKMEKGARKYGKTVWEVAKEFEDFFWKVIDEMEIARPEISCRATAHIAEQIALIKRLESNGLTYVIEDGVYFDTSKFPQYGELAKLDKESLQAGARVEMVAGKKSPTDFALWKFSGTQTSQRRQMEWWFSGPLAGQLYSQAKHAEFLNEEVSKTDAETREKLELHGEFEKSIGFPGWHIECSAMALKYLTDVFDENGQFHGERSRTIDIHTGGIDHIPVHHTNEIAQAEGATGKHPFVQYWVHHNFLRVEGEKMSKSLGNFYTLDDVTAKGYSPMALKLLFLGSHYRSELNFTWDNLAASQKAYDKLVGILCQAQRESDRSVLSDDKLAKVNEYRERFFAQMENDLRTPEAIAILWEVAKSNIPGPDKYDLLVEFDTVLGLALGVACALELEKKPDAIPSGVQMLLDQRQAARDAKDFAASDMLRDEIGKLGWSVEDGSAGQVVKKK